ncbi:UDP-N-acetylmuramate dehydrogenase [Clostridium sp. Marseille-P2415]|uniref:UDP-N-acetylmuramate dehydrogenase n=1 Tax=Clostridium sp. Marseille-P2415 TaxID=1805471 RepID=UPI0009888BDB|nr:UDP-N-acetylmuramate dehydrogenase [Clostridium sp. Marseille-P2415]
MTGFYEKLLGAADKDHVKIGEEMRKHTSFRVGGPAAWFVTPGDEKELVETIALCRREEVPFFILGNGSNLLVGDQGFDGVVVSMDGFSGCQAEKETGIIRAGAGVSLARAAQEAYKASLTGFEFAAGIPGSLGGAVVMNAGAYGSEMKEVLQSVRVLTPEGEGKEIPASGLSLGYRTSCIIPKQYVVLEAMIRLETGDEGAIKSQMDELARRRKEKQPLEYPSAGSTFKRPKGHFAGKLIEEAGLRGFSVGGAQVSEKHCGFVINKDHATAADIRALCEEVKERVLVHSGVELEMEVKTLGKF